LVLAGIQTKREAFNHRECPSLYVATTCQLSSTGFIYGLQLVQKLAKESS